MNYKYNRVMFVTNSLSGGGAERATNILVNALTDAGLQVSLVAINSGPQDLIKPKCQVFELNRKWQGGILSVMAAYLKLQGAVWKWKPNYLVLNCDIPEFLGSLTLGKQKLIAVEHATFPWIHRVRLGKLTRKILKTRNTKWVAVSDHLSVWGSQSIPEISICNAIFMPQIERVKTTGKIKTLNYVGRLSQEKQPIWVMEIAKHTNLPVRFFGDGILNSQIREYAREEKIEAEFAGFVSNPWEFFDEGDLLVVPSSFEGDGLVVVEALSERIPLILNDIADLRRFNLEDKNYASTVEDFAKSIRESLHSIENFTPSEIMVDDILKDRKPVLVGQKWISFFNSLT